MTACGMAQGDIAQRIVNPYTEISIDEKTLRKHFRGDLDRGKQIAIAVVAHNLFRIAISDSPHAVEAARFWLSRQAGWREAAPDALAPTSLTLNVKRIG